MKASVVVAALVTLVGCAGCSAGPSTPHTGPSQHVVVNTDLASGVAHNRAATRAEANRLLGLAPLPRHAKPIAGPQPALAGPAMGAPRTRSLVDLHRFWRVSIPLAAAIHYVRSHGPKGLKLTGRSTGNTGGGFTGFGWTEPDRRYATGLGLDVSLTSVHGTTVIRADGLGEWLDPRPFHDSAAGPRLRVTVGGGCPSSDKGFVGVRNSGSDLSQRLLPTGAPRSALICPYGGLNPPHVFHVFAPVLLPTTAARLVAREASHLPLSHTDGTETNCPMDDDSFVVIAFRYPGRADVDLGYHSTGCQTVANGSISVDGGLNLKPYVD